METQHKTLLAAVLLIGFLLRPSSTTTGSFALAVHNSNEAVISVNSDAAAVPDLYIQGNRGNWKIEKEGRSSSDGERSGKVVIGRKLLQAEIDDYTPTGPNPTHDPVLSPPPPPPPP